MGQEIWTFPTALGDCRALLPCGSCGLPEVRYYWKPIHERPGPFRWFECGICTLLKTHWREELLARWGHDTNEGGCSE